MGDCFKCGETLYCANCENIDCVNDEFEMNKIKTLEQKLKDYEDGHKGACPTCEKVGELNAELEQKLAKAVEVIKFYGAKGNWYDNDLVNEVNHCCIWKDGENIFNEILQRHEILSGKRARQFLKELGE